MFNSQFPILIRAEGDISSDARTGTDVTFRSDENWELNIEKSQFSFSDQFAVRAETLSETSSSPTTTF